MATDQVKLLDQPSIIAASAMMTSNNNYHELLTLTHPAFEILEKRNNRATKKLFVNALQNYNAKYEDQILWKVIEMLALSDENLLHKTSPLAKGFRESLLALLPR